MAVKAIQLLMNEGLPEDLRDYSRSYDAKSIRDLMTEVANRYPDEYVDIIKHIMDIGRDAVYSTGQTSRLSDYKPLFDRESIYNEMDKEVANIKATIKNKEKQQDAIKAVYEKYTLLLQKLTKDSFKTVGAKNNLINAVNSGARGNLTQLNAMVTSPGVYTDFKGRTIPLFIRKSYADGLTPAEYLSSTYGVRNSILSIKKGTAAWGGLGKAINRPLSTMVVTSKHSIDDNGIDYDIDDESLYGRVLAKDAGSIKAGTVLDRNALNTLKRDKVQTVIVKSPIATISENGIPADVVGLNINKKMYSIGEHPGLNAGTALSEPLIQGGLSSKHTAGAFSGRKTFGGFKYVSAFLESPEEFPDKATVSEIDGKIKSIKDAPQGGKYIYIDDKEHYVLPGMEIFVKPGDSVERGEILSDGLADPEDIIRLRGLGEGRRYFTERLHQLTADSNAKGNKRNIELFARAFLDKVKITNPDGLGDFLPEDIISYNKLEANYIPEDDSKEVSVNGNEAVNKYLQRPVLHFTIGTKLTPKMIKRIKDTGIADTILVSNKEPSFEPVMVRLKESSTKGETDWISKGVASYQKQNYIDAASRGLKSNLKENYNPFTRMTQPDFAENVYETGKF
jgi:DNA-directed RNA polymerase subunit beta'